MRTKTLSNHFTLCQENLRSFWLRLRSSWLDYLPTVISPVFQGIQIGQCASVVATVIVNNQRYLVGGLCMGLGIVSLFLHQFFPEAPRDLHYYYVNTYYLVFTLRLPLLLIFGSAAGMLFSPAKWKLAYIPFCFLHALGWLFLIHWTVFLDTHMVFTTSEERDAAFKVANDYFRSVPNVYAFVMAGSLGISIILSLDYLLYRYHHILRNNHMSLVGVAEMDENAVDLVKQKVHARTLAKNFRNINARV